MANRILINKGQYMSPKKERIRGRRKPREGRYSNALCFPFVKTRKHSNSESYTRADISSASIFSTHTTNHAIY